MVGSHEPKGYQCPFCALLQNTPMLAPTRQDVVAERERALAFIAPPRWWPHNLGHVLVIPRNHAENLYSIEPADLHAVMDLVQEVARAMRISYMCPGVSTRQHNEPDGGQDVWHLHVHVFPRYPDDRLYKSIPRPDFATPEERQQFAQRLQPLLAAPPR